MNYNVPGQPAANAEQINAEHEACCRAANDAIDHAMRCGELLTEAKAAIPHGQWQPWLADSFRGSARNARVYMQLWARRAVIEAKRQRDTVLSVREARRLITEAKPETLDMRVFARPDLIPSPGHGLAFDRHFRDGDRHVLVIEPASLEGCYYVNVVRTSPDTEYGDNYIEGRDLPVRGKHIGMPCWNAESIIEHGTRIEFAVPEPLHFNRWLYESNEHYLERRKINWSKGAKEVARERGATPNG